MIADTPYRTRADFLFAIDLLIEELERAHVRLGGEATHDAITISGRRESAVEHLP